MDAQSLGTRISALRKEKGWTQKELAARLHVTDKAVSKWETAISLPDVSLWQPMANLFQISLLEFLGMEDTRTETAVHEVSEISKAEKEKLKREFRARAWLNIVVSTVLLFALLGASYLFQQNGMYGLPQVLTMGMVGMTALITGNAVYTLIHCKKL
ncbi:MAG: helix-turn-helix transcriptional regulator [Subdoligranulum sp.]|nr:helix-turn-helix transcriptional regulator [Subdoligranulum sp.]